MDSLKEQLAVDALLDLKREVDNSRGKYIEGLLLDMSGAL